MNIPDSLAEEYRHVLKDLLRFFRAMARGDEDIARQAAQHLEESLETLVETMRLERDGN